MFFSKKENPEMTRVKFCYTVKGRKYAIALLNTLKMSKLEPEWVFIFAGDDEAKKYFDEKSVKYRESYGCDIYNDKILNAMSVSIERPNQLIVTIDAMSPLDKDVLFVEFMRNKWYFEKNHNKYNTYLTSPEWIIGGYLEDKDRIEIYGGLSGFYNITTKQRDLYVKLRNDFLNSDKTVYKTSYGEEFAARYRQQTRITEEEVFENIIMNNIKDFNICKNFKGAEKTLRPVLLQRLSYSDGGKVLNSMIERKEPFYENQYYFRPEYWKDLMECENK